MDPSEPFYLEKLLNHVTDSREMYFVITSDGTHVYPPSQDIGLGLLLTVLEELYKS